MFMGLLDSNTCVLRVPSGARPMMWEVGGRREEPVRGGTCGEGEDEPALPGSSKHRVGIRSLCKELPSRRLPCGPGNELSEGSLAPTHRLSRRCAEAPTPRPGPWLDRPPSAQLNAL